MIPLDSKQKAETTAMLAEAYRKLGIRSVSEIDARIKTALDYLSQDREHYIEVVDADTPDYLITTRNGVICKLIPLAREVITDKEEDHTRQCISVFSLMIAEHSMRYVYSWSYAKIYPDPTRNTCTHPIYHFAKLADIHKDLRVSAPCEIRPIATPRDWDIYRKMFAVFAHLNRSQPLNSIPHKTERAVLASTLAIPESITVDGKAMHGKLIPLAREESMFGQIRKDHQYSYIKELHLFVTETDLHYLIKTRHIYDYFRVIKNGDDPGNDAYVSTKQEQETTYAIVTLADIPKNMHPLYY